LDEKLRALAVDEVVLAGQHTHICERHSSYGALIRGYEIAIPADAVCAFEGVDENEALADGRGRMRHLRLDSRSVCAASACTRPAIGSLTVASARLA